MQKEFLVMMKIRKLSAMQKLKLVGLFLILAFFAFMLMTFSDGIWTYIIAIVFVIGFIGDIFREQDKVVDVILKVNNTDDMLYLDFSSKYKDLCFSRAVKHDDFKFIDINDGLVRLEYIAPNVDNSKTEVLVFGIMNEDANYWENLKSELNL